jgi:hypothetical protein
MRKTLMMITMLIFALTVSCGAANATESVTLTPPIDTTIDPMGMCEQPVEVDERGQHIDRIVAMWTMWFDEEGASKDDYRRDRFYELATYVVDSVKYYQENETDIGGKLPNDNDIDMLVALIATRESSVDPMVVGKLGEVGILQVHGMALAGYKSEYVRSHPDLGVKLGVRWLAHQTNRCPADNLDDMKRPLSLYAGGPKNAIKNGKCLVFGLAKERVEKTKVYVAMLQQS